MTFDFHRRNHPPAAPKNDYHSLTSVNTPSASGACLALLRRAVRTTHPCSPGCVVRTSLRALFKFGREQDLR